jgi:hypothetical protein
VIGVVLLGGLGVLHLFAIVLESMTACFAAVPQPVVEPPTLAEEAASSPLEGTNAARIA